MEYRLISKLLGIVALLIGGSMVFSLPWAFPRVASRHALEAVHDSRGVIRSEMEVGGLLALLASMVVCGIVGGVLLWLGRKSKGQMFRKEALAVVGLSWILATVLGALPFYFSGTNRCCSVRLLDRQHAPLVYRFGSLRMRRQWDEAPRVEDQEYAVLEALNLAGAVGLSPQRLSEVSDDVEEEVVLRKLIARSPVWSA